MRTLYVAESCSTKTHEYFIECVSFDKNECVNACADNERHNPGYEYSIEEYRTELEGSAQEVLNAIRDEDIQPDYCDVPKLITRKMEKQITETLLKCFRHSVEFYKTEWNVWFDINTEKAIYDEGDSLYYRDGLIFLHSFNAQYHDAIDFAYDAEEEILDYLNADELAQLNDAKQNDPFFNGNVNYVKENFWDKFIEFCDDVYDEMENEYNNEFVCGDFIDCIVKLEEYDWVYAC